MMTGIRPHCTGSIHRGRRVARLLPFGQAAALTAVVALVLLGASPASAAITYRSSTSNTASSTNSIVLSTPADVQVGDVMVASVSIGGASVPGTLVTPAGWTQALAPKVQGNVEVGTYYRVVNGGGTLEREYAIGSRRMDVCLRYGQTTLAMELKVWRDGERDPLNEGLEQLDSYLSGLGLQTGWLVIFDQRSGLPAISERTTAEKAPPRLDDDRTSNSCK